MRNSMYKMKNQAILKDNHELVVRQMQKTSIEHEENVQSRKAEYVDKIFAIYQKVYASKKIFLWKEGENNSQLLFQEDGSNFTQILFESIVKLVSNPHLTIAVYKVCVSEIDTKTEVYRRRMDFLRGLGEYIFDNLWQDDNRHYT